MGAFLRIGLFAVAGPPIGLVVFMLYVGFATLLTRGTTSDFVPMALLDPANSQLAYLYGGGPAVVDGLVASLLAWRLRGANYWFVVAAAGAVLSVIGCWASGTLAYGGLGVAIPFAVCGFFAGFACAALFDALARLVRR